MENKEQTEQTTILAYTKATDNYIEDIFTNMLNGTPILINLKGVETQIIISDFDKTNQICKNEFYDIKLKASFIVEK